MSVYSKDTPRSELIEAIDLVSKEIRDSRLPNAGLIAYFMSLLQLLDRIDDKRIKEKRHAAKTNQATT